MLAMTELADRFRHLAWAALSMALIGAAGPAAAAATGDVRTLPPLDGEGRNGYAEFLHARTHRAFAIAPGGAWSWRAEMPDAEQARAGALEDCATLARRPCFIYAVDSRLEFEPRDWARAWRPYAGGAQAARAAVGMQAGQRFPDLVYRDPAGRPRKLSDQRGHVVLLHFWGSWCPPCQREMPDLEKLLAGVAGNRAIQAVFLPVREPVAKARQWAKDKGLRLGIADGGADAAKDGSFSLADGGRVRDRDLARVFPTTYVLDRHGLVLFSHFGPVADWGSLAPLLRDAAAASGR